MFLEISIFLPPFVKLLDNSDLPIILGDGFSLSAVINRKNEVTALAVLFIRTLDKV